MTVSGGLVHRRTDIEQVSRGWCDGSAIQIHECVNPGHASLDVGFRGDPCGRPEGASSVCSRCMQLTRMRLWARHDYRLAHACTVITIAPVPTDAYAQSGEPQDGLCAPSLLHARRTDLISRHGFRVAASESISDQRAFPAPARRQYPKQCSTFR